MAFCQENKSFQAWTSNNELPITLEGQTELKNIILDLIEIAEVCIKLCSFILTDSEIINALLNKLRTTDCCIFILTQLDSSKFSASLLTEEELQENTNETHLNAINSLFNEGAHIRAAENVHAKFIIVDNKKL